MRRPLPWLLAAFCALPFATLAQSPQDYIRARAQPLRSLSVLNEKELSVLDPYSVLMLGELHGTNEPVRLALALADGLARRGDTVLLGFEIPEAQLGAYPAERTAAALAASPFFKGSTDDGRGNRAWYDALLRAGNNPRLHPFFFDPGSVPGRDSLMAMAILRARAQHPTWKVVTISGNIHNRRTGYKGDRCAAGYLELLAPELAGRLATINIAFAEGSMRANTGNGVQVQRLDNRDSDFAKAAPSSLYLLLYPRGTFAYDGIFFVRKLTAAETME